MIYIKKREDKKEIVEYNGEPVYDGDFYTDMEEYLDSRDGEDLPEFIDVCDILPVPKIDVNTIEENLCEELAFEDSMDALNQYKDLDELREFINKWNAKQTGTFWQVNGKKVRVPRG